MDAVYLVEFDNGEMYDEYFTFVCGVYSNAQQARSYVQKQKERIRESVDLTTRHSKYTIYKMIIDDATDSLDETSVVGEYYCH